MPKCPHLDWVPPLQSGPRPQSSSWYNCSGIALERQPSWVQVLAWLTAAPPTSLQVTSWGRGRSAPTRYTIALLHGGRKGQIFQPSTKWGEAAGACSPGAGCNSNCLTGGTTSRSPIEPRPPALCVSNPHVPEPSEYFKHLVGENDRALGESEGMGREMVFGSLTRTRCTSQPAILCSRPESLRRRKRDPRSAMSRLTGTKPGSPGLRSFCFRRLRSGRRADDRLAPWYRKRKLFGLPPEMLCRNFTDTAW